MSYRNKKYRALKRQREKSDSSFEENISDDEFSASLSSANTSDIKSTSQHTSTVEEQVVNIKHATDSSETRSSVNVHTSEFDSNDESCQISVASEHSMELLNPPDDQRCLREKLRDCAIKHVNHITCSFLNDLLFILRSEGHTDLPKTAETLLCTKRTQDKVQPMLSKKGTFGTYIYLGIADQLKLQLTNSEYAEREIKVLINVDGLPIYARSKQQMWPILMQILHKDYNCKPIVVALYCGDSKPNDANDFMKNFTEECTTLIEQGIVIGRTLFTFKIAAFVCDTPARAFIKCCKGHTAFYGCERCEIHGKTVNKKRVYPQTNCALRTKDSFTAKSQTNHHIPDRTSPLIRIPGFNPIDGVVLDYMHLLCCGVMKSLMDKWLSNRKQKGSIGCYGRNHLTRILLNLSPQIPIEFQRKLFDINDITNWKATQYRFILLYGGLVLRTVISSEMYRHFLLLLVACRILCSRTQALVYTDDAESYLRKFFKQMSKFYGKDSQTMNFHNLIHVADDVRNMKAPLTEYSSFPFESCLGSIKKLIRTPRNPVAQVFRRLSENKSDLLIIKKNDLGAINCKRSVPQNERELNLIDYSKINIRNMTIGITKPDNVVKLTNNNIFKINRIFSTNNSLHNIYIQGKIIKNKGNAFTKPILSSSVGIYKIGFPFRHTKTYSLDNIVEKCLILTVETRKYAITLLHIN